MLVELTILGDIELVGDFELVGDIEFVGDTLGVAGAPVGKRGLFGVVGEKVGRFETDGCDEICGLGTREGVRVGSIVLVGIELGMFVGV